MLTVEHDAFCWRGLQNTCGHGGFHSNPCSRSVPQYHATPYAGIRELNCRVYLIPPVGDCNFLGRPETESLRSLLGGSEAEAASLRGQARKEREELMSRLLRDKGRCVWLHSVSEVEDCYSAYMRLSCVVHVLVPVLVWAWSMPLLVWRLFGYSAAARQSNASCSVFTVHPEWLRAMTPHEGDYECVSRGELPYPLL